MTPPTFALRVERLLYATRDRVFDAWIAPEHLWKWYHFNDDWKIVAVESDPRSGGQFRVSWKAPDGKLWHELGEYREVVRPERIVMTCRFDFPDFDENETLLTVEFHDRGKQTLLVILQEGYKDATHRDNHQQGWPGFLDQLAKHLG
jgi:uncharacterized protein YndB with AHSA1/START domain